MPGAVDAQAWAVAVLPYVRRIWHAYLYQACIFLWMLLILLESLSFLAICENHGWAASSESTADCANQTRLVEDRMVVVQVAAWHSICNVEWHCKSRCPTA